MINGGFEESFSVGVQASCSHYEVAKSFGWVHMCHACAIKSEFQLRGAAWVHVDVQWRGLGVPGEMKVRKVNELNILCIPLYMPDQTL